MNHPDLSPAAQLELKRLMPAVIDGESWDFEYAALLRTVASRWNLPPLEISADEELLSEIDLNERLASREIPDTSVIEVKNQGLAAWEKSREELRVALELKGYAAKKLISMFGKDQSMNLPLEEFLASLNPRPTAGHDRASEFMEFLRHLADRDLSATKGSEPNLESRSKQIDQIADVRLDYLETEGVSEMIQADIREMFKKWRKCNQEEHSLSATNTKKRASKAENMEKMLQLLPQSNRANETMDLATWKKRAKEILDIPERTFDRYKKELKGRFEDSTKGRFRGKKKPRDDS
jgi:hypothetical protein